MQKRWRSRFSVLLCIRNCAKRTSLGLPRWLVVSKAQLPVRNTNERGARCVFAVLKRPEVFADTFMALSDLEARVAGRPGPMLDAQ